MSTPEVEFVRWVSVHRGDEVVIQSFVQGKHRSAWLEHWCSKAFFRGFCTRIVLLSHHPAIS